MLALAIHGLFTLAAQAPTSEAPAVPRGAELDALIARLPEVGHESVWDTTRDAWIESPDVEAMKRCVAEHALTDVQWRRALLDTGAIRYRARWPEDEPYAISMREPRWMGLGRITMTPHVAGWRDASAGATFHGSCGVGTVEGEERALYQVLGSFGGRPDAVLFDVLVERGHSWIEPLLEDKPAPERGQHEVLWRGTLSLPVAVVESLSEAVPAVSSADIERAVASAIGIGFSERADAQRAYVSVWPDRVRSSALRGVGLALEVRVEKDGRVQEVARLPGPNTSAFDVEGSGASRIFYTLDSISLKSLPRSFDAIELQRWRLRILGTDAGVLAFWKADRRWSGEIVVPLATAIEQEAARVRRGDD